MTLHTIAMALALFVAPPTAESGGPIARAVAREGSRLASSTQAAPAGWEKVRDIESDTSIVVTTRAGGIVSGRFLGADDVGLAMNRANRIEQIPADNIVEVKTVGRSIGRGAGIGAALGAAVAGAVILPKVNSGDESGFYGRVNLLPILTGAGAGVGAVLGARESAKVIWARTPGTAASSR